MSVNDVKEDTMPIYLANQNVDLTIQKITGSDKIKKHLENLGFIAGETVMLINRSDDNVILKIKGVSLAISHELSKRILV